MFRLRLPKLCLPGNSEGEPGGSSEEDSGQPGQPAFPGRVLRALAGTRFAAVLAALALGAATGFGVRVFAEPGPSAVAELERARLEIRSAKARNESLSSELAATRRALEERKQAVMIGTAQPVGNEPPGKGNLAGSASMPCDLGGTPATAAAAIKACIEEFNRIGGRKP
jgi:hypothetical protein